MSHFLNLKFSIAALIQKNQILDFHFHIHINKYFEKPFPNHKVNTLIGISYYISNFCSLFKSPLLIIHNLRFPSLKQ